MDSTSPKKVKVVRVCVLYESRQGKILTSPGQQMIVEEIVELTL